MRERGGKGSERERGEREFMKSDLHNLKHFSKLQV